MTVDYQQGQSVRIEGDDLDRSRAIRSDLDRQIHELGALIGRSLGEDLGGARLEVCLIKFDNDKVLIEQGGKCWALEDPPGLSRECTAAEKTIMSQSKVPVPDTLLEP